MKKYTVFVLTLAILTTAFTKHRSPYLSSARPVSTDTLPQVCNVLPGKDIEALHPFTTALTTTFPDPNSFETYTGCYYQFYTDSEKPQLAVRLMKWGSKQEAMDEFRMQAQRHHESWGISPERLEIGADSAYFSIDPMDLTKCDECHLVAIQGTYSVYISFKGQPDGITRDGKKLVAVAILKLMYDRIPGLAPSRSRNRQ